MKCEGRKRKFHVTQTILHVLPAYNKTEAGVAQQEKMKNINVSKYLYVDARSMENKQQALGDALSNEVNELVGQLRQGRLILVNALNVSKEGYSLHKPGEAQWPNTAMFSHWHGLCNWHEMMFCSLGEA